jgi:hypothetical protein
VGSQSLLVRTLTHRPCSTAGEPPLNVPGASACVASAHSPAAALLPMERVLLAELAAKLKMRPSMEPLV